jgi:hypothetical protein
MHARMHAIISNLVTDKRVCLDVLDSADLFEEWLTALDAPCVDDNRANVSLFDWLLLFRQTLGHVIVRVL